MIMIIHQYDNVAYSQCFKMFFFITKKKISTFENCDLFFIWSKKEEKNQIGWYLD